MKITPLPSEEQLTPEDWRIKALASVNQALEEDRNQGYTSLVEGIEGRMEEYDGGAYSTQLEKQVHDREVFLYNQALTDILENVVKPLYGKK